MRVLQSLLELLCFTVPASQLKLSDLSEIWKIDEIKPTLPLFERFRELLENEKRNRAETGNFYCLTLRSHTNESALSYLVCFRVCGVLILGWRWEGALMLSCCDEEDDCERQANDERQPDLSSHQGTHPTPRYAERSQVLFRLSLNK